MEFIKKIFGSKHIDDRDNKKKILDDELKHWRILRVENKNQLLVVRLRIEKPEYQDINQYKEAVVIQWSYENDMPSEDVNQKQIEFEDAIDYLTGDNDFSYLIQIGTGMGLKEWVFYTKSKDNFIMKFNQLLKNKDKFPLDIQFYEDSEWKIWSDFLELFKKNK